MLFDLPTVCQLRGQLWGAALCEDLWRGLPMWEHTFVLTLADALLEKPGQQWCNGGQSDSHAVGESNWAAMVVMVRHGGYRFPVSLRLDVWSHLVRSSSTNRWSLPSKSNFQIICSLRTSCIGRQCWKNSQPCVKTLRSPTQMLMKSDWPFLPFGFC
jgi:hypothetical protein